MVDMNMDVGEFFKNLFKKKESKDNTPATSSEKIKSKTPIMIGGAILIILIVFLIYFFIFRPKIIEKKEQLLKKENYQKELIQLESQLQTPVYKPNNSSDNDQNQNKQIEYYKILVKYQVTGNYLRYMNFKESIANMDKIVHFEKEEIKVMPKKKGIVIADGILSVIRLP